MERKDFLRSMFALRTTSQLEYSNNAEPSLYNEVDLKKIYNEN